MKKLRFHKLILLILVIAATAVLAIGCDNNISKSDSFTLTYFADDGGCIIGDATQSIEYGSTAAPVTAVPNQGYLFAGWSDGKLSETRQDSNIKSGSSVTANFIKDTKTLTFDYNSSTGNHSQKNISLTYDNVSGIQFPVPERSNYIFKGWYLDPNFTTKVTDENGIYFLGNSIFYYESTTIYAKWITEEPFTYKILMVFVEETHIQLPTVDGTLIDADYKMSLIERKICELIPEQMSKILNEWFEDLVIFEIDTYFTTESIGNDSYHAGMTSTGKLDYSVFAKDIPELGPLLKDYRSIITTSCMNDYDGLLHSSAGNASDKYALVNMEMFLKPFIINDIPLEDYLDLVYEDWKTLLTVYIHEFAHTVETAINAYEYHEVISYYWNQISELAITRLYLLNQAIVDDETVGIPFEYWKGDIDVQVNYVPSYFNGWSNGKILIIGEADNQSNTVVRKVPFGSDLAVEAIPFEGYTFSHWSDGVTTAVRHDTNIISYLNVTAIFVPIE